MKKTISLLLLTVIALGLGYYLKTEYLEVPERVTLELKNGIRLTPVVMDSPHELSRGLTREDYIEDSSGALFIFEKEGYHRFWTKDMKFPVDILWINEDWQVVEITRDAQPSFGRECPSYFPKRPARYALEINSGLADRFNITVGDVIRIIE
jgi:uncharacterized membrane protein (UPF0127 family)